MLLLFFGNNILAQNDSLNTFYVPKFKACFRANIVFILDYSSSNIFDGYSQISRTIKSPRDKVISDLHRLPTLAPEKGEILITLITFSVEAFQVFNFTNNVDTILSGVLSVSDKNLFGGGTDIQKALQMAWRSFNSVEAGVYDDIHREIVIVSDGGLNDRSVTGTKVLIDRIKQAGINVSTISSGHPYTDHEMLEELANDGQYFGIDLNLWLMYLESKEVITPCN